LSLEHWETYYRSGALATCPTTPAGDVDGEVREAWVSFFEPLPDGARLVDIGTGNGVIALLAAETAAALGRHWEVHGIDLARIDPEKHLRDGARRVAGIRFHPETAIESLPFEAGSIDAVCGHYALENAERDRALAELHRVLRPGGRARFIMHHAGSLLVQNGQRSLRHADWVLNETKLYRRLRRFLEAERSSPATARAAQQQLNDAARLLQYGLLEPGNHVVLNVSLDAVQKLLEARRRISPAAMERQITRVEQDLRASVRRLRDLVELAIDAEAMAALQETARARGFAVSECVEQFHGSANLVGWRLTLERP
jgi:ubiquinone/menaquinone biosynthesis C-methylase UbiE